MYNIVILQWKSKPIVCITFSLFLQNIVLLFHISAYMVLFKNLGLRNLLYQCQYSLHDNLTEYITQIITSVTF